MATIVKSCAQSADDAVEIVASGGDVDIDDVTIFFGSRLPSGDSGLRFSGISGLSGVTIDDAVIEFHSKATDSGAFVADWSCEKTASPAIFTAGLNNFDITGRSYTTATCEGDGSDFGNWTNGVLVDFPPAGYSSDNGNDFTDLLQEVVDAVDPDAFVFMHSHVSGGGERGWATFDDGVSPPPELTVDYTAGGAAANPWDYYAQQAAIIG